MTSDAGGHGGRIRGDSAMKDPGTLSGSPTVVFEAKSRPHLSVPTHEGSHRKFLENHSCGREPGPDRCRLEWCEESVGNRPKRYS